MTRRLLIVEDDAQNNQMIREYLETQGFPVPRPIPAARENCFFPWRNLTWFSLT